MPRRAGSRPHGGKRIVEQLLGIVVVLADERQPGGDGQAVGDTTERSGAAKPTGRLIEQREGFAEVRRGERELGRREGGERVVSCGLGVTHRELGLAVRAGLLGLHHVQRAQLD